MRPRCGTLVNMASSYHAESSEEISEEIELLQAIYVNELELQGPKERPSLVNLFLHPSTGDDNHDCKYVCLNLTLAIPQEYPHVSPGISIKNPRGLSDAHITSIQENLIALSKEKIGAPMLYDLIEYAKECLSDNNIPSCPCVICLEHFEGEEQFVKTECYHYFHSTCLGNYIDHFLRENKDKQIVCPMCRLDIVYNKSECDSQGSSSAEHEEFVFTLNEEQLAAQAERQRIFEYQKSKGGIIDVEEERNRYLIGIKNSAAKVRLRSTKHRKFGTKAGGIAEHQSQGSFTGQHKTDSRAERGEDIVKQTDARNATEKPQEQKNSSVQKAKVKRQDAGDKLQGPRKQDVKQTVDIEAVSIKYQGADSDQRTGVSENNQALNNKSISKLMKTTQSSNSDRGHSQRTPRRKKTRGRAEEGDGKRADRCNDSQKSYSDIVSLINRESEASTPGVLEKSMKSLGIRDKEFSTRKDDKTSPKNMNRKFSQKRENLKREGEKSSSAENDTKEVDRKSSDEIQRIAERSKCMSPPRFERAGRLEKEEEILSNDLDQKQKRKPRVPPGFENYRPSELDQNARRTRRPPPGFETTRPTHMKKGHKLSTSELDQPLSNISITSKPPPGFENVKPFVSLK